MPAKSVASKDIQFPHAMKPQHHIPLPSSVIFLNLSYHSLVYSMYRALSAFNDGDLLYLSESVGGR